MASRTSNRHLRYLRCRRGAICLFSAPLIAQANQPEGQSMRDRQTFRRSSTRVLCMVGPSFGHAETVPRTDKPSPSYDPWSEM
jgi:hypothetical protein